MPPSFSITSNLSPSEIPRCLIISAGHEKTGLKPVFDNSAVCYDVVRHKGPDRLLRFACRLPPRLPPGRLRTIRYSNVHRTFELRSCPHGFESLLFSYENKKTSQWMSFCFVDDDLFEPPWLRLNFLWQVVELAFSINKVHKKIFPLLNFS